jgi:hypothetical protein
VKKRRAIQSPSPSAPGGPYGDCWSGVPDAGLAGGWRRGGPRVFFGAVGDRRVVLVAALLRLLHVGHMQISLVDRSRGRRDAPIDVKQVRVWIRTILVWD